VNRASLLATCAALTVSACGDGQAGADYRGEPLMTLNGVVTSSSVALTGAIVPGLVLAPPTDGGFFSQKFSLHFIQGEVEGTFPSAFTLRVYEPPPDDTLAAFVDGEARFANAQIAAFSPQHPRTLTMETYTVETPDASKEGSKVCAEDGKCISGLLADCPAESQADSPWPCGAKFPADLPWETYGYSRTYSVIYFAEDSAAGSLWSLLFAGGKPISRGYHVQERIELQDSLSSADLAANNDCTRRAVDQAYAELGRIYGREFSNSNQNFMDAAQLRDWYKYTAVGYGQLGCQIGLRVVDSSAEHPVELLFTDQPQRLGLW
jgi:hypothetical protein